jgi:pentatricopeptide repeat protein
MAFEAPRSKEERAGRVAKNRAHQVENRLRGQPFRNAPDTNFRGELHGTSLGRFNLTLSNASRDGQTQVTTVLRVAAQMREEGVQPDITTFHHILRSLADHGLYAEAVACVDEMDRLGIMADPQAFYYILQVR